MYKWLRIKRIFDFIISFIAILLLSPVWLLISLCVYLEDPGPIFYRQTRVGKDQKLFTLYKFRSMYLNNIPPLELGAIKHNHVLVTKVGYIIRRFKLDETLQFLQVLVGQMSLVGPRPCLPVRLSAMSLSEKRRFIFLPGLTGWAEVNGNVELTWEEQVLLDIWYINHVSFKVDIEIIFRTIWVVLFGSQRNELALMQAKKYYF